MSWPTTDDPRTEFVTVRFTVAEAAELDSHAQKLGMSRSAAVRDATGRVIAAEARRRSRQKGGAE